MYQIDQSKQEWDEFREFEAKKHKWFLYQYPKLGMRVIEDTSDQKLAWDVVVDYKGKVLKIDEKARQKDYGDILVEDQQDVDTSNKGWLHSEIDGIFYASWVNPLDKEPSSAYMINLKEFRILYEDIKHTMKENVSTKGFGRSVFKTIAPDGLLSMGVATRVV